MAELDGSTFLADFDTLSAIGASGRRGVDREAATPADGRARTWLTEWLTEHGFRIEVDSVGNIFGLLEWVPGAPYVLAGSHLDSQPTAGRFDGAYGVLAAAHAAARTAKQVEVGAIAPRFNLAVVDWFNEEGSRFSPSLMGSGVFIGKFTADEVHATTDRDGVSVSQALTDIGFLGSGLEPTAHSYVEIHNEQGRTLEREGASIGIVDRNWAAYKYKIQVHGEQSHTGATHLCYRRDALVTASHIVLAIREVASAYGKPGEEGDVLGSVGQFTVAPNSPVVVPATVTMAADLRSHDEVLLEQAHTEFMAELERISNADEATIEVVDVSFRPSTSYQSEGVALATKVATELGLSHRVLHTMAGHDSVNLKDLVPTVMLFVPSVAGVSHNTEELTSDTDMVTGVLMLTATVTELVTGALNTESSSTSGATPVGIAPEI